MNRRGFLKGLAATAAGLLIPADVAAEPERKVWALDSTMMKRGQLYTIKRSGSAYPDEWTAIMDLSFTTEEWWKDFRDKPFPQYVTLVEHDGFIRVPYDDSARAYLAAKKRVEDDIMYGRVR